MKVEGDSECWRALRVFSQKEVRAFVNARESDGTVLSENGFRKRKRQLKRAVDEATRQAVSEGFAGASEQQKVQPLGILRQCQVDRC